MAIKTIGIDVREAGGHGAGKGRYAEEITKALIKLGDSGLSESQTIGPLEFRLYVKEIKPELPRELQVIVPGRGIFWHLNLRRELNKNPVDFFISPTSFIYPAIAASSQKLALVVHDMIAFLGRHRLFPTLVERLTLGRAIKNSQFIITISQNTYKDLCKIKPAAAGKKVVFASPGVQKVEVDQSKSVDNFTNELPPKFILAVGTLTPRKNLAGIFKAFQIFLRQKHQTPSYNPSEFHLCIAGERNSETDKLLAKLPAQMHGKIHFLGYLEDQELQNAYKKAACLVYPSLYEGFGIPPLEAMACGTPVLTSNTSSLPEVVGDAAVTVDPTNVEEIAAGIEELLQNSERYRTKGLERAKLFSWENSARSILEAIHRTQ